MKKPVDTVLTEVTGALKKALGKNLISCCVYGSAVRGNAIEGISDINLLLLLENSNAAAHQAIADVLADFPDVDPFILQRRGLQRTAQCFATKFASIKRNHRVLHGEDPFAGIETDPHLERLICEQALHNLRLRLSYAFATNNPKRPYDRFLQANISALFIQLSDVLRLAGHEIPKDFAQRIPVFEKTWGSAATIMSDLLALRLQPQRLEAKTALSLHERTLGLLDVVIGFTESKWSGKSAS